MGESKRGRLLLRKVPLFIAVASCLYGASAFAQEQVEEQEQQEQATTQQEATELDRITVTGSLLRRVEYESISPVQVITAETNMAVGQVSTSEFLQKSSVAAGTTQLNTTFGAYVTEGGVGAQSIDLRGLGANRTLVLLNGHRPGPAGTRGQVGAFDLNVIPASVVQRIEILKDGSSSTYGSDAVAGVVNLITRKNIDRPEISIQGRLPFLYDNGRNSRNFSDGGEVFNIHGATGFNFDSGSIVLAADYFKQHPLKWGARDYLACPRPLVSNQDGADIQREDVSMYAGTDLEGCLPSWYSTIRDSLTGVYYDPFRDAAGEIYWDEEIFSNYDSNNPQLGQGMTSNPGIFPGWRDGYAQQGLERFSVYASSDFAVGALNWKTEALWNRRKSEQRGWRQFFPNIYAPAPGSPYRDAGYFYADDPDWVNPYYSGLTGPIMPFTSNTDVTVDYYYINTGLDGLLSFTDTWAWEANLSFSRSDGEYTGRGIDARRSGDWALSDSAPTIDYHEPCILLGTCIDKLDAAVGITHTGKTVYDQTIFRALATGELFNLPAGAVGAAIGVEYRDFSINDQPSEASRNGWLWGSSSAQETRGEDTVKEIFAELEAPLLRGLPGVESLTFNGSIRAFEYDSVDESADPVWKMGLGWQIVPSLRVRATKGTSYRAPGLYELYLGDQTGFLSQLSIDPCIDWGNSDHPQIRANCAAAGIPEDHLRAGPSSSATSYQGGGLGFLNPETSKAFTAGLVWTPAFANFSVALDYFEYEVRDQIGELGAGTIIASCYGSEVYPNNFCDMFTRNPADHTTEPYQIDEVWATYVNINRQKTSGFDLLANYERDFNFGALSVVAEATYTKRDIYQQFDSPLAGGSTISDYIRGIGRPQLVGNLAARLTRDDVTYSYGLDYVHATRRLTPLANYSYAGWPDALHDTRAERRIYHSASVQWKLPKYEFMIGMANITDRKPDTISSTAGYNRLGNIPLSSTQYDLLGRQLFGRLTYKF